MIESPETIKKLLEAGSELPVAIAAARGLPFSTECVRWRPLSNKEIEHLELQGSRCSDWSILRVHPEFIPDHIYNTAFHGHCCLGLFKGDPFEVDTDVMLPDGIYDSIIGDSTIMSGSLISKSGPVTRYLVMENVLILNCGIIAAPPECSFGIGEEIHPGSESGGREIMLFPELTIEAAEPIIRDRITDEISYIYGKHIAYYLKACTFPGGIIEKEVKITGTPRITGSFIGSRSIIKEAALIEDSVLLSEKKHSVTVAGGSIVRKSTLQWGASAEDLAIVDSSLLMEYASARRHGKVTGSIIGANTEIAEGEVTCSLLGPFTGFHHQSLLIAALWPKGKGNVGYGANIGSNHTGKAPDQEIIVGEGMFFGLGSSIKFPANYEKSPYSIIATGVTTLPQKVEYPFSLINTPGQRIHQMPLSYNELSAGWVLSMNLYIIMRNRLKFKSRNRATRFLPDMEIFRHDLVETVKEARDRLADIRIKREIYLERDLPGIGKNYITERNRKSAVYIYSLFTEFFILINLLDYIKETDILDEKKLLLEKSKNKDWEQARLMMDSEKWSDRSLGDSMQSLIVIAEKIARNTRISKERDDGRGKKIIPDYAGVTMSADMDQTITETDAWTTAITEEAQKIISRL